MLPRPGFYRGDKVMYAFVYENDAERWLGKHVLCKFKSFEKADNGFAMEAEEYNAIRNEVVKMQKKVIEKYSAQGLKVNTNTTNNTKKPGDERDLLFLN